MNYRIIVADDHLLVTQGLVKLIDSFQNFEIIATAQNGVELLALLNGKGRTTDIVILDICMPRLNGLKAIESIKKDFPHCKILVCTMYLSKDLLNQLHELGVDGIISKNIDASEFEKILYGVS